MNVTESPQGGAFPSGTMFDSPKIGGIGYGIAVSVGILILITTITLASYFCTRNSQAPLLPPRQARDDGDPPDETAVDVEEVGVDEATLMSYPKLLYAQTKVRGRDRDRDKDNTTTTTSCCSICLADYKDTDVLRLLPDCKHMFHLKCVDPWLRLHPTCPVCRTSPLPSPVPTPLSELVPLARRS